MLQIVYSAAQLCSLPGRSPSVSQEHTTSQENPDMVSCTGAASLFQHSNVHASPPLAGEIVRQ